MLEVGNFVADRYEVLAKAGAGGMSDVYKARDHVLGRVVAVKVLKSEFADDVNFVTKFRSEAQSAAGLEHPNIVSIYDVGSEDGLHFIVMEYIEGITLKTYIEKKRQLSYKETISIAIQVGRGIEAAHNKNIVHRDIKPQNIIISTEGKVKVADFGIARAATSNTIHSDVMGSVHYSSPEQARNGFVDCKSDIYSLGIVMYEMVTGRVPFDGDTTVAIAIQHLQEEMESPRRYVPDLPVSLEKIILKCTQKSADRRYAVIGDLLADLKHALVNPDDDFVTVVTPASVQDKTRIISENEVSRIKEETSKIPLTRDVLDTKNTRNARDTIEPSRAPSSQEEDDDDGGFLNPKMEKAMTIMGIIAAVIILVIVVFLVGSMLGSFKFPFSGKDNKQQEKISTTDRETPPDKDADTKDDKGGNDEKKGITMISLLGEDVSAAQKKLVDMGLQLYTLGREASDDYEEGQIISQDVEEGEKVAKGTVIKVTVSSGPGEFALTSVVGSTESAARKTLEDAELKVSASYEYSDKAEGLVIGQSPGAGSPVKKGDTIRLIVSQGRQRVQVPDIRKQTQADAAAILTQNNLGTGSVTSEYDDSVPEGQVISQNPQPGDSVYTGTSVDYVISLGKKEVLYELRDTTIRVQENEDSVIAANIQLIDANGQVVDTWNNVSISSFPYTISHGADITTSSGTISIEWILDNGSTKSETKNVQFSQQ